MELSTFEAAHYKDYCKRIGIALTLIVGIYAGLCTPVYLWTTSNILVQTTVFPILWDYVTEIVNYLFFWVGFSAAIYAVFSYGFPALKRMAPIYALAALARYFGSLLVHYLIMGFPELSDFVSLTLPFTLLDVLFDCVMLGTVVLVMYMLLRNRPHTVGKCYYFKDYLPYRKTFDLKNLLCRTAFVAALLPPVVRLFGRIRYDLYIGGAQSRIDLIWQIVSYASDVIFAPVGYLVLLLLINKLYFYHEEANARYEAEV